MSDVLTITADRVREAAKQCPEAKRLLETLFPEALKAPEPDDTNGLPVTSSIGSYFNAQIDGKVNVIGPRAPSSNLRGFYLDHRFRWAIETDRYDQLVLVARRKR